VSEFAFPMRAHRRGHPLVLFADRRWRWAESGRFMGRLAHPAEDRDCAACGLPPTPEGYDACIGHVPGAVAACCGHGIADPYVLWEDRSGAQGDGVPWQRKNLANLANNAGGEQR
jgi:hypothetical protein